MTRLWTLVLLVPVLAHADPPAPQAAPQVVVNVAPAVSMAAAPTAQSPQAFALDENQANGFYLGIRGGIVDADRSNLGAGLAPKFRFGRFFALEGVAMLGVHRLKKTSSSVRAQDLSAFLTAQITFHSVLFSFTPKFGLGYLAWKRDGFQYSGGALRLGSEVEMGRLILSAEITNALSSVREESYDVGYLYSHGTYPYYDSYRSSQPSSLELGIGFRVGGNDRLGFRISGPIGGSRGLTQQYGYYEIGF